MLKALELVGFKSFADRTRFEFPSGITVVVGPNGSGKSNVVDAIKWVLGEQSVKSLRGKEMADVIFNGSGTRRAMNTAEITLTFDNSNRVLAIDTPEVHITRRVYRSGEGDYLINRQPCRLRDIRDLLSGTGMGTQAYSVIEQGKVDVLLQSSPRDRRVIFEEAAGISRFKAKKLEALRRLDRDVPILFAKDTTEFIEGFDFTSAQELDWDESVTVKGVRIEAMRVRHWGKRYPWDRDRGYNAYLLSKGRYAVLFAGDTAYTSSLTARLARRRVDVAMLPIGSYNPWISNHASPDEAWEMFRALDAGHLVPMHWRTFKLSKEPTFEPMERLWEVAGPLRHRIAIESIGQTWTLKT